MTNITVYYWEPPPLRWMKFNVAGVVLEDKTGCGEILRDDKRVACALFSGRIEARGTEMAEIMEIKKVMDTFIRSSRKAHVPLIIELCSFVASEWLTNRSYRSWSLWKIFGDIDCGTNRYIEIFIFLKPHGEFAKSILVLVVQRFLYLAVSCIIVVLERVVNSIRCDAGVVRGIHGSGQVQPKS
ncbi:hypothetical protein Gotur_035334 [Gossypium turneri]